MTTFVDQVRLHAKGGDGGHGCASIRREKYKPLGGPDGGNGGRGGSVILEVEPGTTTLLTYHFSPHQRAESGTQGMGHMRQGKNGADLVLPVPSGTVVRAPDGEVLADLVGGGTQFVLAEGGAGGLGNAALASKRRKAPGFALRGEDGEEVAVILELKSVADVALVGYPSSGKSSLIAAMSAARPKIADYPFTTLVPNLGVVQAEGYRYTMADVPGLIPGASEGKGLGLDFLRHIERCSIIVHVLDCATLESNRDPLSDLDLIERELASYAARLDAEAAQAQPAGAAAPAHLGAAAGVTGATPARPRLTGAPLPLMDRPRAVVLNKMDVPDARVLAEIVRPDLEARGLPIFEVSAVSRDGLRPLSFALGRLVEEARAATAAADLIPARIILRPKPVDAQEFTVTAIRTSEGPAYQVRGSKPERWVRQTDFANDEAVGYLAERLAKLGIEDELFKQGATPGATVVLGPTEGGVIFDWEPTMVGGAEHLGARGTDARLEEGARPSREQRRREYDERRAAKRQAREEIADEREAGIWTDPGGNLP